MKTYGHLTSEERSQIEVLSKEGYGPTRLGARLGRSKSTMSTELRRLGRAQDYAARAAQENAQTLAAKARVAVKGTLEMREELRRLLVAGWSPQQISGRWQAEGRALAQRWSHEHIYQIIGADRKAGGRLWQLLRRRGRPVRRDRCGKRRGHRLKVTPEQELAQRPAVVNERLELGHWEVDLVIGAGQQGVLLVAVERVTLLLRLRCLPSKEAAAVEAGMLEMLEGDRVRSLTYDRGLEWMRHEAVGAHFEAVSWFCLPYHSWEKGGVENMNGQIRYYFPKHEPFPYEEVEMEWVQEVEDALNGRPRRILGYRTPQEALRELSGQGA